MTLRARLRLSLVAVTIAAGVALGFAIKRHTSSAWVLTILLSVGVALLIVALIAVGLIEVKSGHRGKTDCSPPVQERPSDATKGRHAIRKLAEALVYFVAPVTVAVATRTWLSAVILSLVIYLPVAAVRLFLRGRRYRTHPGS